ncbi:prenyltransferase/squalene oxidase repeat-containing protein [Streptomyces sp. URMC 129]|uniref:prenyltransferase/squalene oxidase repeat-containing protein n=1 Tax=Streptomyces sp. URMC 129 TaxID=3423407 RepID=UPI003F1A3AFC
MWLKANQNVDFGWGSHAGQPSRVFLTAISMLALQECYGDKEAVTNAQRWLIDAQSPQLPAWGPLPGAEPTVLHTSAALMALSRIPGALSVNTMKNTAEWLLENIEPGVHVERSTTVEEYDVPYDDGHSTFVFQNSLPHFAGPMALTAILYSGVRDPLDKKIFEAIDGIVETQLDGGHWELPRSPTRPSVWAIWPFVSALSLARRAILSSPRSRATLLFPGCAIMQDAGAGRNVTRSLLIRNAVTDWARTRWVALVLWLISLVTAGIPGAFLITGHLSVIEFLMALIIPVLLMLFQYLWDRKSATTPGGGSP